MELLYSAIFVLFIYTKPMSARSLQGHNDQHNIFTDYKQNNYNNFEDIEKNTFDNKLSNYVIVIQKQNGEKNNTKIIRILKSNLTLKMTLTCFGTGNFKWLHHSSVIGHSDEIEIVSTDDHVAGLRLVMMTKKVMRKEDRGLYECVKDSYTRESTWGSEARNGGVDSGGGNNITGNFGENIDDDNSHQGNDDRRDDVGGAGVGGSGKLDFSKYEQENGRKAILRRDGDCRNTSCVDEVGSDDEGVVVIVGGYVSALESHLFVKVGMGFHLVCLKSKDHKRLEWFKKNNTKIEFENQKYQIKEEENDGVMMSLLKVSNASESDCVVYVCKAMRQDRGLSFDEEEEEEDYGVKFNVKCLIGHRLVKAGGNDDGGNFNDADDADDDADDADDDADDDDDDDDDGKDDDGNGNLNLRTPQTSYALSETVKFMKISETKELHKMKELDKRVQNISLFLHLGKDYSSVVGDTRKKQLKMRQKRETSNLCPSFNVTENTRVNCVYSGELKINVTYPEGQIVTLRKIGVKCSFSCLFGWWLSDSRNNEIKCQKKGDRAAWEPFIPFCRLVLSQCPSLRVPESMTATCWFDATANPAFHVSKTEYHANEITKFNWEGTKCELACIYGYKTGGSQLLQCRQSANRTANYEEHTLYPEEWVDEIYLKPYVDRYAEYDYTEYDKENKGRAKRDSNQHQTPFKKESFLFDRKTPTFSYISTKTTFSTTTPLTTSPTTTTLTKNNALTSSTTTTLTTDTTTLTPEITTLTTRATTLTTAATTTETSTTILTTTTFKTFPSTTLPGSTYLPYWHGENIWCL